ncbi:protein transporter Sec31 [Streptomyces sp. LBUM 1479]|uniref:protein transporter Sec31 n=1 Tax=Streptomyces scabiei TaxID=1930 RepID=UPI001B337D80|nr:protein transporter Sec31 [Streptomyces scabiei]MBP5931842.1 protein transporter Sec31 [Streptomyces sp. LBUM 1479]MDX3034178.1 protein transporter Sec31 [Streptomyces scabiei]
MKTRTTTQLVPHTIDGKTRMIPVKVDTPAPPRDWDQLVLNGVTGIAALVLLASVIWSTASIGDLLAHVVHPAAAYGAAIVFDLVWIACMAVEWLARNDADGAPTARRAGRLSLLVAMAAVAAHGWLAGYIVIGIVGAVVSALAKGLWTVVLNHQTPPLDERTRAWIHAELAEAGASLALIPVRRRLQRAQGLVAAERAAIASPDTDPDQSGESGDDPDDEEQPSATGPMTVKDAVRTALDSGIADPERVLAYVRKVADANAKLATVERYIRLARTAS